MSSYFPYVQGCPLHRPCTPHRSPHSRSSCNGADARVRACVLTETFFVWEWCVRCANLHFSEVCNELPECLGCVFHPVAYESVFRSPKEVGTVSAVWIEQLYAPQALAFRPPL